MPVKKDSEEIRREFFERYKREFDYYAEAARLVATRCETELKQAGIRAIVTSRGKRIDSLQSKLANRSQVGGKTYESIEEIYADIVDLAGVRIAVYFPGLAFRSGRHFLNGF